MAQQRVVRKSKAGVQDLVLGKGQVTQTRGGNEYTIDRIDQHIAVDSIAEMTALDVEDFTRARLYTSAVAFVDYIYDASATEGEKPDDSLVPGYWVLAERDASNDQVLAEGTTTPRDLATRFATGEVWVEDFGADLSDSAHDDTLALKAALATGKHVRVGAGTLTLTDTCVLETAAQTLVGSGRLKIVSKQLVGYGTRVLIPLGTVIPKTVKTRRVARTSAADPDDAPMSALFELQAWGCNVHHLSIELGCDYSDMSPTNNGADCDVAIFNACRQDPEFEHLSILGYFRKAGIYLDVTFGTNIPDRYSGVIEPDRPTGSDRIMLNKVEIDGSWKDVFLAGPILNGADTYYDDTVGLVAETRGGSGASDLDIGGQFYLHGRNHHSGWRGYDPVMDPDAEDIDAMTGSIVIDSRRGSASQGRTRRIHIHDGRITTYEAARVFTGRAYEVLIWNLHTEPGSTSNTRFDTSGNVIDVSDTVNVTYGPLACQSTVGNLDGSDQVHCHSIWGTGVVNAWTSALVTNFSNSREFVNPKFAVTLDSDLTVGDDLVVGDTAQIANGLSAGSLSLATEDTSFTPSFGFVAAPSYTVQVGKYTEIAGFIFVDILLTWSGLDTADVSNVTLLGLPVNKDSQSGFIAQIDTLGSSGLVSPHNLYFDDNGSSTQIGLYSRSTGSAITYDSGSIAAAGTLALTISYRG